MTISEKLMASMFQAVTTRTAGFESISQSNFTDASSVVSLILMFIGGFPKGTAGGIKTTTIAVLFLTVVAYFRGKQSTNVFGRKITEENMRTAVVVTVVGLTSVLIMVMLVSTATGGSFLDVVYEVVSAVIVRSREANSTIEQPEKRILIG